MRRQDDRTALDRALLRARLSAYPPGEFVGQESFMLAGEIMTLAERAGIAPGVSVLDLCCGVAGPGLLICRKLGCSYLGVDASPDAVRIARERAAGLDCRFEVGQVPPLPAERFDVVLLLETMLAFPDKAALLREIASVLKMGGRFAFTLEEGPPLTATERAAMPHDDTVWLTPLTEISDLLEQAGLRVRRQDECSRDHLLMVDSLIRAFTAEARAITAQLGGRTFEDLLTAHRLWRRWLRDGRVRKFALVAERADPPRASA